MGEPTPGPWLVNPARAWIEVPDADAPICAMLWPTDLRNEDETFDNARLIAAAPELLAALQEMLRVCDLSPDDSPHRSQAIAAINKALGK